MAKAKLPKVGGKVSCVSSDLKRQQRMSEMSEDARPSLPPPVAHRSVRSRRALPLPEP